MPHPNRVGQIFEVRYPTPAEFLRRLERDLDKGGGKDLAAERILARLGSEAVIGGVRAAGFSGKILAARGVADLDVGLALRGDRLLAMDFQARLAAVDELVESWLDLELGDHFVLQPRKVQTGETGAFYEITARVHGTKVAQLGLDVDCDPHLTAPVSHSFSPLSDVRIPGLISGIQAYQNPADVLAGKLLAIARLAAVGDKSRYAKHLCDVHYMLTAAPKRKRVDPRLAARSIAEISEVSGIAIADLRPPYLRSAQKRYRSRRKKISPDLPDSSNLLAGDLAVIRDKLQPILEAAQRVDLSIRTSRVTVPDAQTVGSYAVATAGHPLSGHLKRNVVPDALQRTFPMGPSSPRSSRAPYAR